MRPKDGASNRKIGKAQGLETDRGNHARPNWDDRSFWSRKQRPIERRPPRSRHLLGRDHALDLLHEVLEMEGF